MYEDTYFTFWYCTLIRPLNATGDRNRGGAIGTFVISHTRRILFSRRTYSGLLEPFGPAYAGFGAY